MEDLQTTSLAHKIAENSSLDATTIMGLEQEKAAKNNEIDHNSLDVPTFMRKYHEHQS